MTTEKIDAFTRGYLEAALWTADPYTNRSGGEWAEHDEWRIANIDAASLARAIEVCADFQAANREDLAATGASDDRNGVDFWLTRNGHGAGFWDRGYGEVGDRLTKASKPYGEAYCSGPETTDQGAATDEMLAAWDGVITIAD